MRKFLSILSRCHVHPGWRWAVVILAGSAAAGGCATRSALRIDVGSYSFVAGEFVRTIDVDTEQARADARRALELMGISGLAERRASGGWVIAGEDSHGRRVYVRIARGDTGTRVSISVGTIGDEQESAEIFKRMLDVDDEHAALPITRPDDTADARPENH